jgi:Fe2+ or Zn2+ uptake regulation protein
MPKKNERPTAKHIMEFLEQNKGVAIRFKYIYKALRKKGYRHNFTSITDNLRYLIKQGKIVRIKSGIRPFYGIPKKRQDGSSFIVAKKVYVEDEIIELG